jgi:site-specific recombinase XerD
VPVKVIQKILGHSQISTTLRYIYTDDQDIADGIAKLPGAAEPVPTT